MLRDDMGMEQPLLVNGHHGGADQPHYDSFKKFTADDGGRNNKLSLNEQKEQLKNINVTESDLIGMRRALTVKAPVAAPVDSAAREMQTRKKEQERTQERSDFNKKRWLLVSACVGYVICGSLFYMVEESWSVLDAVYFSFITFFTVGYGDLLPTTSLSQWFTCFYAFTGIMIIASALSLVGESLLQRHEDFIVGLTEENKLKKGNANYVQKSEDEKLAIARGVRIYKLGMVLTIILVYLVGGALVFMQTADWSFGEAFYFCSMTVTTIGYGDKVVDDSLARFLSLVYVVTGITVIGWIMNHGSDLFLSGFQAKSEKRIKEKFTLTAMKGLDSDGDGQIDYDEYLTFMLVSMGAVDVEVINEIRSNFAKMDIDGDNCITLDDNTKGMTQENFFKHIFEGKDNKAVKAQ